MCIYVHICLCMSLFVYLSVYFSRFILIYDLVYICRILNPDKICLYKTLLHCFIIMIILLYRLFFRYIRAEGNDLVRILNPKDSRDFFKYFTSFSKTYKRSQKQKHLHKTFYAVTLTNSLWSHKLILISFRYLRCYYGVYKLYQRNEGILVG